MAFRVRQLGIVTIPTAGTPVRIQSEWLAADGVILQAEHDNTGRIYYGDDDVNPTDSPFLVAKQAIGIDGPVTHHGQQKIIVSEIYVDADVDGEKVRVGYLEQV